MWLKNIVQNMFSRMFETNNTAAYFSENEFGLPFPVITARTKPVGVPNYSYIHIIQI